MRTASASADRLMSDLRAVLEDAEALLSATAGQAGEKIQRARERATETVRVARERLSDAQEEVVKHAKKAATPLLFVGAGLMLIKLVRGGGRSVARRGGGLAMKALFWVSMAQRALPYVTLARDLWRSRSRRPYADAGAETEHLL